MVVVADRDQDQHRGTISGEEKIESLESIHRTVLHSVTQTMELKNGDVVIGTNRRMRTAIGGGGALQPGGALLPHLNLTQFTIRDTRLLLQSNDIETNLGVTASQGALHRQRQTRIL